jgi:hypothetical protein
MIETIKLSGRSPVSWRKKLNPLWWFANDFEEQLPDWYRPEWPRWRRQFYWQFLRNPLQNFRAVVLGVCDRNYTVTGRAPVMAVQRNDLPEDQSLPRETGWQWCVLYGGDLRAPAAFVSYSGVRLVWYVGWQPSGFAGFKLTIRM